MMRTIAQETALQITLRIYSKKIGGKVYMWFWWRGHTYNQAHIFCRRFLQISWESLLVTGAGSTMKDFSIFLDTRKCKNQTGETVSWEHLTMWKPVLLVLESIECLISALHLELLSGGVEGQHCSSAWDLIIVEVDGKCPPVADKSWEGGLLAGLQDILDRKEIRRWTVLLAWVTGWRNGGSLCWDWVGG